MDAQNASAPKQKGIKKLWIKFKASMKSEQSGSTKSNTATSTSKSIASTTTTSPAATKPKPEPVPAPVQDTNTMATQSTARPEPEPEKKIEETKPESQPVAGSEMIQVDDDEEDYEEKSPMPQTLSATSDKEATALRYQRAQDIFKKYNLEMDPADWQQPSNSSAQRVEKKPRMRVRYTCHECKQTFGREKKCSNCTHKRCDSCVRYPPKKIGDNAKKPSKVKADLTPLTAPTTGECHACKTTFDLGATECANCQHEICSRCLKETVIASPATAPPPAQPITVAAAS